MDAAFTCSSPRLFAVNEGFWTAYTSGGAFYLTICIRFEKLQPRENFASPHDTDANELHELHTPMETSARHDHISIAPSSIIKLIHHVL